jgi:hypothetical protein
VRNQEAIAGLFGEVLTLCARSGLAKVGVIAVDGTKVHANASRNENLDYEQLAREIVEEAKAVDAAEDELYGQARGDELPPEFATAQGRRGWLREAKQRLEAERAANPQPVPRNRPKRLKEAKRRLEEELWTEVRASRAYEAYRPALRPPAGPLPAAGHAGRAHQPHRPRLTRGQGPARLLAGLQRAGGHQRAPGRPSRRDRNRRRRLRAPGADARRHRTRARGRRHRRGSWGVAGRRWLLARRADATRRNWDGGRYDQMREVLASDRGGELYRKRQPMIEPVFAQMKFNRGLDRFRRRGRGAVRAEWRLITATHNLLKLHRHAIAAA